MIDYRLCGIFVNARTFVDTKEMLHFILIEEINKRSIIDDGIATVLTVCVKPCINLVFSMDWVNVWSHTNHFPRQVTVIPHLAYAVLSHRHLPC